MTYKSEKYYKTMKQIRVLLQDKELGEEVKKDIIKILELHDKGEIK